MLTLNKKSYLLALAAVVALSTGCSTAKTRVFPGEGGQNVIVASSHSESDAYDAALEKGSEYCEKTGHRFVMVNQTSQYQGMDKNAKAGINLVGSVLGAAARSSGGSSGFYPEGQAYSATHSVDDNKVTVTFKCQ